MAIISFYGIKRHFHDVLMCVLVTKSFTTLCDPWTVDCQAPLSMGFSRPQYWSELPFPTPGDLPNPKIEPRSPTLQAILYHLSYLESPCLNDFEMFAFDLRYILQSVTSWISFLLVFKTKGLAFHLE